MEFLSDPNSSPESAAEPSARAPSDEGFQRYLRSCTETQLIAMLRNIQKRLGTAIEIEGDFEIAQHVAHQLNNLRTCRGLEDEIGSLEPA